MTSAIRRFSSRCQRLDHAFLAEKLAGAKSYRRIAGYFRKDRYDIFGSLPDTIDPDKDRWELCSRVLARRDIVDKLSVPW